MATPHHHYAQQKVGEFVKMSCILVVLISDYSSIKLCILATFFLRSLA